MVSLSKVFLLVCLILGGILVHFAEKFDREYFLAKVCVQGWGEYCQNTSDSSAETIIALECNTFERPLFLKQKKIEFLTVDSIRWRLLNELYADKPNILIRFQARTFINQIGNKKNKKYTLIVRDEYLSLWRRNLNFYTMLRQC